MKNKPVGRVLPPKWKYNIDIQFHRQFVFKERLKILLGYNADIKMVVVTEHHCGKFQPVMDLVLTPAIKPRPGILSRLFKRKPKTTPQ